MPDFDEQARSSDKVEAFHRALAAEAPALSPDQRDFIASVGGMAPAAEFDWKTVWTVAEGPHGELNGYAICTRPLWALRGRTILPSDWFRLNERGRAIVIAAARTVDALRAAGVLTEGQQ